MRSLLLSLLLCLPATYAQEAANPPKIEDWGSTPYAALLRVYNAPGYGRNWSVEPPGVKLWHAKIDGMGTGMVITGPPGTYTATCRLSRQAKPDEDQADQVLTYTFTLGAEPVPPGPGPPVPPPVPPPVDPFVQAIRDAAAADSTSRSELAAVGDATAGAVELFRVGDTAQAVHDAVKAKLATGPRLGPALAAIMRGQTSPVFNPMLRNPAHPLTAAEAQTGKDLLGKLAQALYGASRQ